MTSNQRRAIRRGVNEAIRQKEAGTLKPDDSITFWAVVYAQRRTRETRTGFPIYLGIFDEAKAYAEEHLSSR